MNKQDKNIATFSRMANYVVKRQQSHTSSSVSYEYLQEMINKMNTINHMLMASAIRMINKAKKSQDVNIEELTMSLKNIIHGSVQNYAQHIK